jgi:hypothetical protein
MRPVYDFGHLQLLHFMKYIIFWIQFKPIEVLNHVKVHSVSNASTRNP